MPKSETELVFPKCPFCGTNLHVVQYKGYYESFCYWDCAQCMDAGLKELVSDEYYGSYA